MTIIQKQRHNELTKSGRLPVWITASALLTASIGVQAEVFELEEIVVYGEASHPSRATRDRVEKSFDSTRTTTSTSGGNLQNLNAVNNDDALRMTTTGLVNSSFSDRFNGPVKIRTFGNFGTATSIDGMPGVRFSGEEGGGYANTRIPTIAIEEINVHKGGRAVQYGNSTDGGVFETNIKSGRGYTNHFATSIDQSSAGESVLQAEAANSTEGHDYYLAGSYLYGDFDGTSAPSNLDGQTNGNLVGKFGFNLSNATRIELLGMHNDSDTDAYRNDELNNIDSSGQFLSATVDHRITDNNSVRVGALHSDTDTQWPARDRDRSTIIDTLFADYFMLKDLSDRVEYAGSIGTEYTATNTLRDNQWDNNFNDYAVKLSNALTIDDNATFTFGLRNTWFDNDIEVDGKTQPDNLVNDSVLSWETGAAYSVAENTRLRASASTGYNRFYGKYGNFGTDALNPAGAEDEIVESLGYEFGINQGWHGGYLDLAFYMITQDNVPRRNNDAIQNVEVEQSGVELEVFSQATEKLSLTGGYTHIFEVNATRSDGTDAQGNIFFGENGVEVAHNQFILSFNYRLNDRVSLWGAGIHGEPFERDNSTGETQRSRSSYDRFDLGAAYVATDQLALRVRVENITDEKDFGQALEGAPIDTEGRLGRVFWVGLDYKF